ncbi:MAG: hypothetical protein C4543_10495 [Ignavibacteriales bacterium]|nr:MAG: hypothetical protein C4543_10495 [Ignavibacteriales bacterium]
MISYQFHYTMMNFFEVNTIIMTDYRYIFLINFSQIISLKESIPYYKIKILFLWRLLSDISIFILSLIYFLIGG